MSCPAWLPVDEPGSPCPECGEPIEHEVLAAPAEVLVVTCCTGCPWTDTTAFERVLT